MELGAHGRGAFAAGLACIAFATLALPAVSAAATVEVREVPGDEFNQAELIVHDDGAERNDLTLSIVGETVVDYFTVEVVDAASALTVGKDCQGGGAPGVPVTCLLREPRGQEERLCGRDCVEKLPGTGWTTDLLVRLGDGANRLSTAGFTDVGVRDLVDTEVETGSGEDRVQTTGEGATVIAGTRPGGEDFYDLGGYEDKVTYGQRDLPVALSGSTVRFPGEVDRLSGVEIVEGSSAGDSLKGGADTDQLEGGPGNDHIFGEQGADELLGGDGNDVIHGGDGNDELDDGYIAAAGDDTYFGEAGRDRIEGGSGDDAAYGGKSHDLFFTGEGNDKALGGGGDDHLAMEEGHDRAYGGAGNDFINGGAGSDFLAAGSGNDFLNANHGFLNAKDRPDRVDCGSGRDSISPGPSDGRRGCEEIDRY